MDFINNDSMGKGTVSSPKYSCMVFISLMGFDRLLPRW